MFYWIYLVIAELAERSPITVQNSSNPSSRKNLVVRPYNRTTVQGATLSMRNGRARDKVMRRRDCARNLDTTLVCAKRHRQTTIKCAYSNVELQCSVLQAHG